MEIKDYCERVGNELAAWKAKMNDVNLKANALKGVDKEKAGPVLKALNAIMDDIDRRIGTLARECPAEWGEDKSEIDGKIAQANEKWKEVWGIMGEAEYGIGGA